MLDAAILEILRERTAVPRGQLSALVQRRTGDRLWVAGLPKSLRDAAISTAAVTMEVTGAIHRCGDWWVLGRPTGGRP